ncbi:ATP-dependent RNA helicase [Plantactinospora sp. KLBMP9567]|uniref:ATP-dependent RNA helicase n=1 Tax=Plantactinospora sp. KLBMP9567 TaxID=3085900 RepID=UPI0029825007|nr:ATP-dependent helicase C-terminal domain-containing protein [Plantactinospora sp. KLBMP9567]MDW5328260.1 ATP-dependent helicase C-terminal domain-containing protein [Plantactinospora sp. KLBMP9567]
MSPSESAADLPVRHILPALTEALAERGAAVLVAPPGAGKTTLVPLALADQVDGRIVVAQPRRVAARAAARRMAELRGERVGETVGYAVRGERRTSARTRIEVVTTGLLVQRLQHDPELPGVGAVLLDEAHERQLDADLALAFGIEVRAALRPELHLLAMSATAQEERLGALLGTAAEPAPVLRAEGRAYPVDVVWVPPPRPVDPPHGLRVDPRLLDHLAATVRRALAEHDGDLLVFLPGAGEINGVAGRLTGLAGTDLVRLHGRQSSAEQDAALRPAAGRRRVVLATAVAETSLTVPGVRVVVDAGLSRVARTDLARGLGALVTVPVSRAAATQRAGRAGREAPGRVYRCWSAADHDRLPAQPEPEIAVADLTSFALQLACWGRPDGTGLALPDPPPAAAMQVARATLEALGAVAPDGRVTGRGRAIAAVGAHPRLARALLDGAARVRPHRAAEVVAVLAESAPGDDLVATWRRLRSGTDPAGTRWRAEVNRLRAALDESPTSAESPPSAGPDDRQGGPDDQRNGPDDRRTGPDNRRNGPDNRRNGPDDRRNRADNRRAGRDGRQAGPELPDDLAAGLLVGLAYPERLARARQAGAETYLMAGGTAADLAPGSPLAGAEWLAISVADRAPGRRGAVIRQAAVVDGATAREAGAALLRREQEIAWSGEDVVAREVQRLGAIVLLDRPLARPDPARVAAALRDGLRQVGLDLLAWTRPARELRARLAFCRQALGGEWPEVTDAALLDRADEWLGPELATARRRADLARIDVPAALRRLLPWREAARLDELAPERLAVPSGSRYRVDYSDPAAPVLAVKLQETFGWRDVPRIADGRVPVLLHLLSPAGRPVAVTRDLASFWRTGYPQVRAELRGRYPRHPWPADPTGAPPTRGLQPRRG